MTHTAGPWVKDYGGTLGHIKSVTEREDGATPTVARYDLAAPSIGEDEREENALLIAAAPDLLEIAVTLATLLPHHERYDLEARDQVSFYWMDIRPIAKKLNAIVTKATKGNKE